MVCERLGAKSVEKILLTAAVLTVFTGFASAFAGGSGTQTDPYEIANCIQLQEIQNGTTGTLSDHYELVSDIDCSATENWNNGNGFKPIGGDSSFTGVFDGKGYVIEGPTLNRSGTSYVALFAELENGGELKNFDIRDVSIRGGFSAGSAVGIVRQGSKVSGVLSSGKVSGSFEVGGLVGHNEGEVLQSYSSASVSGDSEVGGIVGRNQDGKLSEVFSTGEVEGSESGLVVGRNHGSGTILTSYFDSSNTNSGIGSDDNAQTVTPLTTSEMQGLSASENMDFDWANNWRIRENDYPVPVQINGFSGGSGTQTDPYRIETCEQLQDMNQDLDAYYELVSNVECRGTENWNNGKGFNPIGDSTDTFTGSFSGNNQSVYQLTISRGGSDYTAPFGFLGSAGEVREVKFEKLNVTGNTYVSGAVAFNEGDIAFVSTGGEVSGSGNRIGGIAGENNGASVTSSLSSADISGNNRVGGITGNIRIGGTVSESFASGTVSGSKKIGGISGPISGSSSTVSDSYSVADVTGNEKVGGLAGRNAGGLLSSFGAGKVSGTTNVGGAVGTDSGDTVTETYWDTVSTGQSSSDGGTPLTTSEMQGSSAETNMNLDFQGTWETVTGSGSLSSPGYPILRDLNRSRQIKAQGIARFEGGSGTPEDPYEIATCQQLQDMNQDLTASYELVSDIDCSETTEWNGGKGFKPVGTSSTSKFSGSFDGNSNSIKNIHIERPSETRNGLFGTTTESVEVSNLAIANGNITGGLYTGGLVGVMRGEVKQSTYTGRIDSNTNNIGGLVGLLIGNVSESFSDAYVTGDGPAASLVGKNIGIINESFSAGAVVAGDKAGGIVGRNDGEVSDVYSTATIVDDGSGRGRLGAIAGNVKNGFISEAYWNSDTAGVNTGIDQKSGSGSTTTELSPSNIQGSSAQTNMNLDFSETWQTTYAHPKLSWQKSGSGTQDDPYQIYTCRDLQAMKNDKDAYYELAVDVDCSATTEWNSGNGFAPIGTIPRQGPGFRGELDGKFHSIEGLTIDETSSKYVGLFGGTDNGAFITRLNLSGVYISGSKEVGGIVGRHKGVITKSTVSGQITSGRIMGGLIGRMGTEGTINQSFASVTVSGDDKLGGIAGDNTNGGRILNSYAKGSVSGTFQVGGITGRNINGATLSRSYSTAKVSGSGGGVVADNRGGVSETYWDTVSSGESDGISKNAGDVVGLTTSEMQGSSAETNMAGLDFQDVWVTTDGYPELQIFQKSQDGGGGDEPPSDPGIPICDSRGPVFNTCISSTSHDVTGSSLSISAPLRVGPSSSLVSQGERADIQASGRVNISGTVEGDVNISGDDTVIRSGATLSPGEGTVRVR